MFQSLFLFFVLIDAVWRVTIVSVGKSSLCGNRVPAKSPRVGDKVGEPAYLTSAAVGPAGDPQGKKVNKWHVCVDFQLSSSCKLEFRKAIVGGGGRSMTVVTAPQVFGEESPTQTDLTHFSPWFLLEALLSVYCTFAAD